MNQSSEPAKPPEPSPTLVEQARRVVEEYANDLREIIKKLRKKIN